MTVHDYLSTACQHDLCGSCRITCKYCEAVCQHSCHAEDAADTPASWLRQETPGESR